MLPRWDHHFVRLSLLPLPTLATSTSTPHADDPNSSLITVGGSASQIGFLCKTGGELQWRDAQAYANKEGMTVLMSGSRAVVGFAVLILAIALVGRNIFYNAFGSVLQGFGASLLFGESTSCPISAALSQLSPDRLTRSPSIPPHSQFGSKSPFSGARSP